MRLGSVGLCGLLSLFILGLLPLRAESKDPARAKAFKEIKKILSSYGKNVGFSLRTLHGDDLLDVNPHGLFSPASVSKLVSTACTLDELGPDYRFKTQWAKTGSIENGVLMGNLVVVGGGDFSFVIEDLKMIVEQLRFVYGIKEIKGKLIFDTRYLQSPSVVPYTGFDGDRGRAFSAQITAVPIDHNAFSVWITPDNPKPRVEIIPNEAVDLKITNKLKLTGGRLGGSKSILDYRPMYDKLIVSGKIGKWDPPKVYYRSPRKPYESFARLFKYNFEALGGKWKGDYKIEQNVPDTTPLLTHQSRTINRLLIDVNKLSTNFGAEMSLLAAAASYFGLPTGPEKSKKLFAQCIKNFGIGEGDMLLENASGLSRDSKVKADSMTRFLSMMSKKDYWPEFLVTLSVLGLDGTTRSRLKDLAAKARLKTGTLDGVRALAGYIYPNSHDVWSMALFLSCKKCNLNAWNKDENKLLRLLIEKAGH